MSLFDQQTNNRALVQLNVDWLWIEAYCVGMCNTGKEQTRNVGGMRNTRKEQTRDVGRGRPFHGRCNSAKMRAAPATVKKAN